MNEKKEMTQEREAAILEGAIQKFGIRHQVIVAIMLNQLELIFGDPTEVEVSKLERLEGMVQDDRV